MHNLSVVDEDRAGHCSIMKTKFGLPMYYISKMQVQLKYVRILT